MYLKKYLYIYIYIFVRRLPPQKKKKTRLKAIGFGDFSRSQCPQSTESKIATPKFGWQILAFFNLPPRPSRAAEPSTEKKCGWGSVGWGEKNIEVAQINIACIYPENGWLEYYFPIGEAYFQGLR